MINLEMNVSVILLRFSLGLLGRTLFHQILRRGRLIRLCLSFFTLGLGHFGVCLKMRLMSSFR